MVALAERYGSRSSIDGPSPSATLLYWARGTTDEAIAKSLVRAVAPQFYTGADAAGNPKTLIRQQFDCRPQHNDFFYVDVSYGPIDRVQSSWQFDTSGGSHHITQSLETAGAYGNGAQPTNFKGAIAVTGGGKNVEGCDIILPRFVWSERHVVADALVTQPYVNSLADLTGRYNNAAWRGFPTGEILFTGAQGDKTGQDDWNIAYNFSRSPNRYDYDVGGIMVGVKLGWHFQWVLYEEQADDNIHELVQHPKAIYIERVYEPADLSQLGIDYTF